MFSRNELLDAIDELETSPPTYQNCEKLSTFYSLYDHLYGDRRPTVETVRQTIIGDYGNTEFLKVVANAEADLVFGVLDELMETVKLLQPRLYDATISQLKEL